MKIRALEHICSCVELGKFYLNICQQCFGEVWLRSYSWSKYIHFANLNAKNYEFGGFLPCFFLSLSFFRFKSVFKTFKFVVILRFISSMLVYRNKVLKMLLKRKNDKYMYQKIREKSTIISKMYVI
jgi:hypothetical protein